MRRAALISTLFLAACHGSAKPDDAGEASVDATVEAGAPAEVPDADVALDAAAPLDASVVPIPITKKKTTDPPICAQARDAKGRHSPITAQLEAACRAAGGAIDGPAPASTPVPTPTAKSPAAAAALCAQARDAKARHSPLAAQLEAQCRAAGGTL